MATERHAIILIILAMVALVVVIATRKQHAMHAEMHGGIAENEDMFVNADSLIVGDSNPGECCPTGRRSLANVPWQRYMGIFAPLRSVTRQPRILPQQHNKSGTTPLELATVAAAAAGG